MKQSDFNREFTESIARNLNEVYATNGTLDKGMVRAEFNMSTDRMCKDGDITQKQYNNWCTPDGALSHKHLKGVANR